MSFLMAHIVRLTLSVFTYERCSVVILPTHSHAARRHSPIPKEWFLDVRSASALGALAPYRSA